MRQQFCYLRVAAQQVLKGGETARAFDTQAQADAVSVPEGG